MAWVWNLPYPSKHNGSTSWSSVAYPSEQDVHKYILATPEALAASPEVQALIRDAYALGRADGMDEAAGIADDHTPEKHGGMTLAAHVTGRTIAAAIRAGKEPK